MKNFFKIILKRIKWCIKNCFVIQKKFSSEKFMIKETPHSYYKRMQKYDKEQLAKDWESVGFDINQVIKNFQENNEIKDK